MEFVLDLVINFRGEIAALSAAFLWALGSIIYTYAGAWIPAIELNLIKTVMAIAFLFITLLITGIDLPTASPITLSLLLLSGLIGIGLADTFYLEALKQLGARQTLLIRTIDPPTAAILSSIFLQEKLTAIAWCGILLVILGVAWVVTERTVGILNAKISFWGVSCALLSAIGQSIGAVLSRTAFLQSNISPFWTVLLRLTGGIFVVLLWMILQKYPVGQWTKSASMKQRGALFKVLIAVAVAAFSATFLGIWLQQTAIKFTVAGIAQTLNSTSPLFVLPLVMIMGEKVSLRAFLGVLVSIAGVGLLLSS